MNNRSYSDFGQSISRDLLLIVLLAASVRIILFFVFDYHQDLYGGDSEYYLKIGKNIVEHGIHGDASGASFYRPPLYSFFAGLVAYVSETAVFFNIIQSVLFIVFSIVVYFVLRRYDNKLAFLSALLIAASPFDALINGRVLSENLVTPFIVLGTLAFVCARNSKTLYLLSGLLLGSAVLCRDVYLLLPCLFFVTGVWIKIPKSHLVCFLLGSILLIAPWMYRNSQLPSGGVFLSKGVFWTTAWVGTWERDPSWVLTPNFLPPEALKTFDNGNSPSVVLEAWNKRDQAFFKKVTVQNVLNHPLEIVRTWIARYPQLWLGTRSEIFNTYAARGSVTWYITKSTFYLLNTAVILMSFLGILSALRSRKLPALLCLPVVYNALIYIPFHSVETRYSQPVLPILQTFAAFFMLSVAERWPNMFGWITSGVLHQKQSNL